MQPIGRRGPSWKTSGRSSPCCPATGRLSDNPVTNVYQCDVCGRVFTFEELLDAVGMPLKNPNVKMVPLQGNTYPVKDDLKKIGARWNNVSRVWMVPDTALIEAQRIVARGAVLPNDIDPNVFDPRKHVKYHPNAAAQRYQPLLETRLCWECSTEFTEGAGASVWDEYWCGCADKSRRQLKG